MDLVLFGIQGSGKGTQAKRLATEKGYEIFEAGGALRKISASGTSLGEKVKSFIDVGKLVPHEIIMDVLKEAIASQPKDQKILFDGVPRDLDQMRDFILIMEKLGRDILKDLKIDLKNLRFQCEQELKGKLLNLRQAYLEAGAN